MASSQRSLTVIAARHPFTAKRLERYMGLAAAYTLTILGAFITALPFLWMFLSSFKGLVDVAAIPLRWLPTEWRFENYAQVWQMMPFGRFYLNSIFIAVAHTLGVLLTASLGAYGFARIKFLGRDLLFLLYLGTIMVPGWVTLIPVFIIIKQLGWVDSYQGLIIPGLTSAFSTFLLRQFFLTIPQDLEDAAFMDGAGRLQSYAQVILPLSKPVLLTVALMDFMRSWNAFLWPMIIANKVEMQTLPLGLARLAMLNSGWVRVEWGPLMAATLMSILPILILYLFLQNYFIRGIATTGLK